MSHIACGLLGKQVHYALWQFQSFLDQALGICFLPFIGSLGTKVIAWVPTYPETIAEGVKSVNPDALGDTA